MSRCGDIRAANGVRLRPHDIHRGRIVAVEPTGVIPRLRVSPRCAKSASCRLAGAHISQPNHVAVALRMLNALRVGCNEHPVPRCIG
jgi:hypothetical protein